MPHYKLLLAFCICKKHAEGLSPSESGTAWEHRESFPYTPWGRLVNDLATWGPPFGHVPALYTMGGLGESM